MKKNLPVTDNEVPLGGDTVIISTTDVKGAITCINQDFLDISGFSEDELIGVNHNIVRHPDMPPAAFTNLWDTIKAGKSWMGLVKNRCKSGDFYWVDAFVTPAKKNGEITSYESTRVKAVDVLSRRAEKLYKNITAGKKLRLKSLSLLYKQILGGVGLQLIISALLVVFGGVSLTTAFAGWLVFSAAWSGLVFYQMRDFKKLLKRSKSIVDNQVTQLAYYGKVDDVSQIRLSIRVLSAKLRTVVKRIEQATDKLSEQAQCNSEIISASNININQQKQELEMVATAINEMSAAVQEVSTNSASAAEAAHSASEMSQQGALTITDAIGIIDSLDTEISTASSSISQLKSDSENIGSVLDVIRGIAEQTNLLALNAAIEAARAGEQGRGFAVVADEVRTLASRSHDSTQEIQSMIEKLQQGVTAAVASMEEVSKRAAEGVQQVEESAEALAEISGSVGVINDMNTQIAAATEEQSSVTAEVSRNIEQINQLSDETVEGAEQSKVNSDDIAQLVVELHTMVEQFDEGI